MGVFLDELYTINEKFLNLQNYLINIDKQFDISGKSIHKARNELKIIQKDAYEFVVKSFKIPNLVNKIAYTFFRDSKAKKSYLNAVKLQTLDIATPEPVAYIEFYKNSLLDKSYFISVREKYDFTIREVFHHKVDNYEEILKQFTKFTYELHIKGVWHVDYSLGNILITKEKEHYKFSLVDINRMIFKKISPTDGLKNFNKFWAKDENDLIIIAKEYARLANFDEQLAIKIVQDEANKLMRFKNNKKRLKKMVKTK